jgi:hypothetical protein
MLELNCYRCEVLILQFLFSTFLLSEVFFAPLQVSGPLREDFHSWNLSSYAFARCCTRVLHLFKLQIKASFKHGDKKLYLEMDLILFCIFFFSLWEQFV